MSYSPTILFLAGPNGAGKSTSARLLVKDKANFVNADDIARDLPDSDREHAEIKAGRLALERLDQLGEERQDFTLETTLASRTLAPRIRQLKSNGYQFHLIFFCLPSPELAVQRVASRVRMGGHNIPEDTIRRRYVTGLQNFFERYLPIADTWRMYANWDLQAPILVSEGQQSSTIHVHDQSIWEQMQAAYGKTIFERSLSASLSDSTQVTREIARALRHALEENKSRNNTVAVWENDQVRLIPPIQMEPGNLG